MILGQTDEKIGGYGVYTVLGQANERTDMEDTDWTLLG